MKKELLGLNRWLVFAPRSLNEVVAPVTGWFSFLIQADCHITQLYYLVTAQFAKLWTHFALSYLLNRESLELRFDFESNCNLKNPTSISRHLKIYIPSPDNVICLISYVTPGGFLAFCSWRLPGNTPKMTQGEQAQTDKQGNTKESQQCTLEPQQDKDMMAAAEKSNSVNKKQKLSAALRGAVVLQREINRYGKRDQETQCLFSHLCFC